MILWKESQLVFCKLWGAQWDQNHAVSLALKEFPGGGELMRTAPLLPADRQAAGFWRVTSGQLCTQLVLPPLGWPGNQVSGQTGPMPLSVEKSSSGSLLPCPQCPQSHTPIDPPPTMSSCCASAASPAPAALSRFMQNSAFPQSKCALVSFMSNFSLPSITLSILDSVSASLAIPTLKLPIYRETLHPPHLFPLLILGSLTYYPDATFVWPLLNMPSAVLETLKSI